MNKKNLPKPAPLVPSVEHKITPTLIAEGMCEIAHAYSNATFKAVIIGGLAELKKRTMKHGEWGKFEAEIAKEQGQIGNSAANLKGESARTLRLYRNLFGRIETILANPDRRNQVGARVLALRADGKIPEPQACVDIIAQNKPDKLKFLQDIIGDWSMRELLCNLNEADEGDTKGGGGNGGGSPPEQTDFFTELKGDIEKIQNRWEDPAFIALPTDKIVGYGEALIREGKKIVARAKGQPEPQD